MNKLLKNILLLWLAILTSSNLAISNPIISKQNIINNNDIELKAYNIYKQIRCLTCNGQSIEGSSSEFATKLKQQITEMLEDNVDEETVKNELVKQYGQQILMSIEIDNNHYVIWLAPIIILIFGIYYLIMLYRKNETKK